MVFLALSAQLMVGAAGSSEVFPGQSPKLIQNVILTLFFALLIVLLQSAVSPVAKPKHGWIEVAIALLTCLALISTFASIDSDVGAVNYEDAGQTPGLLAFYALGNLYMSYATARGAHLAWTASDHTRSRARLSLRLASAGLAVNCIGTHIPRVVSTSGRLLLGIDPIPGTETWTTPILAIGIIAFFVGIGYPGGRTLVVKIRLWFEARRDYRKLRPLWSALSSQFPEIALFPPVHPLREMLHFRSMRFRYYRRIIECRDGLVSLSPYIADLGDDKTIIRQAELVRDAIVRRSEGRGPVSEASVIAAPAVSGMEADVQELLALACAWRKFSDRVGNSAV
ncbi:hypothetical protein HNR23_004385 [Nocardiopsis mwathae]|uniref:DUF6545 domain-containing protein n=2 Tax=Nocardiopsis mwathae TaxID=1472723 RepID=A0A7W9YLE3_9ACTN|nr:MAB_1171c family putative transporter [Nocardiopsis mwathae]MBB6174325.1 hypothetical protein [Nocardiopsis mwathae]